MRGLAGECTCAAACIEPFERAGVCISLARHGCAPLGRAIPADAGRKRGHSNGGVRPGLVRCAVQWGDAAAGAQWAIADLIDGLPLHTVCCPVGAVVGMRCLQAIDGVSGHKPSAHKPE